jgi:AraC-like DNA-binding protein
LTAETDGPGLPLRSLGDPLIGRALALLHAQPARGWTVDSLAREAAASRSQLAERFSRMLGCPPMESLTRWRMQLSARRMLEGSEPLKDIAIAVGYESDSGFNRTFRRYFGEPPAHWRRRHREQAGTAEPSAPA